MIRFSRFFFPHPACCCKIEWNECSHFENWERQSESMRQRETKRRNWAKVEKRKKRRKEMYKSSTSTEARKTTQHDMAIKIKSDKSDSRGDLSGCTTIKNDDDKSEWMKRKTQERTKIRRKKHNAKIVNVGQTDGWKSQKLFPSFSEMRFNDSWGIIITKPSG